jgi:hypothetical protein
MRLSLFLCAALWFLTAIGGTIYLAQYENTPAEKNDSYPIIFPPETRIDRDGQFPTLIFFSHPKCPCTRASLRELARLMTDVDGKLHVVVVFTKPPDAGEEWTETDLRRSAEAIPGVRVLIDKGEHETRIFKAQTSGLNLLYDQNGNLRFNGGITNGRGHEGDNAGRRAIFEIVTESQTQNAETDVFGCSLHEKNCSGEIIKDAQQ